MTTEIFAPVLEALRANMPPGTLVAFLEYASLEVIGEEEPWWPKEEPFPWGDSFAPGELPEELPDLTPRPEPLTWPAAPEISKDSETPEVAAWCKAVKLNASVVGQWVWVDPYQQTGHVRAELDLVLRAAGFKFSGKRQSWFHDCTVSCRRQPGDKRRGGKLERFHGVTSAADYNPATFDPRPGWQLAKAAKAKARRVKK